MPHQECGSILEVDQLDHPSLPPLMAGSVTPAGQEDGQIGSQLEANVAQEEQAPQQRQPPQQQRQEEERRMPALSKEIDSLELMHKVMKLLDQQFKDKAKEKDRKSDRRNRSPRRKSRDEGSDDESGGLSIDMTKALERYGLQIDVGNLPTLKVVAKCAHLAKKAVKAGGDPIITGRLDERFIPSNQLTATWAQELEVDKPRLQSFWMMWWARLYAQLIIQAITNRQVLTFGQLLDWRSNISAISMSDGAPVAMKYDELAWGQLVAQIEAKSNSADTKSLYELNGSILTRAKQAVEKGMQKPQAAAAAKPGRETKQQPQQGWNGSRSSSWGSKPWAQREGQQRKGQDWKGKREPYGSGAKQDYRRKD